MANALVSLIVLAIMMVATSTIAQSSLSSVDRLSDSWKQTVTQRGEMRATKIAAVSAVTQSSGTIVLITLKNDGEKALRDFAKWDVTLQYYAASSVYRVRWMPYTASSDPGSNQWTVAGIYLDAGDSTPEVFEPGIFNPEEEMVIKVKPDPAVGTRTTNWAIIGTPNGVAISVVFNRGAS